MNTITWLHLSDLHASPTRTGWDANRVTRSLVEDLKQLQHDYKVRPDLVFFTGDAAFGQLGDSPGNSLQDQYKVVQQFLDEVRGAFRPELNLRDIYLVPGNHDVNRDDIDDTQTEWLRDTKRTLPEVISMMQAGRAQWRRFMERLEDYKLFLRTNGYSHLLTDDKNRLIYADEREVSGLRIGIAGFNSAWSCYGGEDDKGRLWSGGKFQMEELLPLLSNADFSIALIHHPANWFVPKEDPNVQRLLENNFEFVLHGHEHQEWVRTDAKTGHTTIWAGACYEHSDKHNGFNMVQLDRETGEGKVWLREYKDLGQGWVAGNIRKFAPEGIWTLDDLKWFQQFKVALATKPKAKAMPSPPKKQLAKEISRQSVLAEPSDVANIFEHRFHEAMVRKYDYLELFGADIPRESQRHSLSVAYVSLNLNQEDDELGEASAASLKKSQSIEKRLPFIGARPVAEVFDLLSISSGRLLVRGVAGGGKSTLLRWAAIQCAKFNLEDHEAIGAEGKVELALPDEEYSENTKAEGEAAPLDKNWRARVPFLIRLRDCPGGQLPRPKEWPVIIAKELPDAPSSWIDQVLTSGRAVVLLDGVDEVPSQKREILAREIESLVSAYPNNYWLVSTRPGAVSKGWLSKLNFLEARIEPMSLDDQDEFIDKWYSAVSSELRSTARRAENLEKVAASLKQELRETPGIARLAIYPLLCAMICALYRERNQKLPETQAALCEDLCKMLLHRRERETPDMSLVHLPPDYRKLDYEHKKYVMAELAQFMVDKGISSLEEQQADLLVATALQHFPDHAQASPSEMRRAFIERSGLLRPSGTDKIDFIHNTLKEYLAAGRFVAQDDYTLLASRANDDGWQPVILFAAALPTPGFATRLMAELLARLPKSNLGKRQNSKTAAKRRSSEFFLVRCRNAAFRLEPKFVQKINQIASGLFPPNTIGDAEVLASLGEMVIPHLNPKQKANARQKVACIRALRLIGGPKAKSALRSFVPGKTKSVLAELLTSAAELGVKVKLPGASLDLSATSVADLSPLSTSTNLHSLKLSGTRIKNLSPLARLKALQSLNLADTGVGDLSPLYGLRNLKSLDLFGTGADIAAVRKLRTLQALRLGPGVFFRRSYYGRSFMLSGSKDLVNTAATLSEPDLSKQLAASYHRYRHGRGLRDHRIMHSKRVYRSLATKFNSRELDEIKPWIPLLADLDHYIGIARVNVSLLHLLRTTPSRLEGGFYYNPEGFNIFFRRSNRFPTDFEHVVGDETKSGPLLSPLVSLKNLKVLDMSGAPIMDLSPLSYLTKLEALLISNSLALHLSPLEKLIELRWLELSGSIATDFSALSKLTKLRVLDLSGTSPRDLSFLRRMRSLELLNLADADIRNIETLLELKSLKYLILTRPQDRAAQTAVNAQLRILQTANRRLQVIKQ